MPRKRVPSAKQSTATSAQRAGRLTSRTDAGDQRRSGFVRHGQIHGCGWYFAAAGLREFYWSSQADAVHSRNLTERPQASIVVFHSSVRSYHGRAQYAVGAAYELTGDDLERGLQVRPGPSARGAAVLTRDDVTGSSPYRLYRARTTDLWVLCPREPGQSCPLHGLANDHRTRTQ